MGKKKLPYIQNIHPDHKLAKNTLAVAQSDIKASECLYNNVYYPQAIFFLQQGIEKGWKAFGYHHGVLTIQEAKTRKYGHNGTNVGKNSLLSMRKVIGLMTHQIKTAKESGASEKQKYENKSENELTLYLQSVHEELLWAQKEIDKATKSSYKPNSKDVTKMLENVNSIRDQERNLEKQIESPKNNPKIIKQVRSGAIEELNRIYKNIPASNFSADETINQKFSDKYIKEILSSLTMGMAIISPLLCFGIITQMHENICRYPEKNRSPLIEYSKNHVLIEYFPQIIQNTTFCLEEMNKYFELEIFQLKEMNEQ